MTTVNKTVQNAIMALTENEENVLRLLVTKGTQNGGTALDAEEGNMFLLEDVYAVALSEYGKTKASVKGTLSNLKKKGLVRMYAGDGYFDGELTEDGLGYWSHLTNTAKVSNQQETKVNDMENNVNNTVMDERLVKMNAILSTKLSAISKNKREGLKAQKSSCKYLIENWDNEENLTHFVEDKEIVETQYELYCIAKSRIDQLQAIRRQEERKKIDFDELATFKGNPGELSKDANQVWAILHGYFDTDKVMQDEFKDDELFSRAMEYRKRMIAYAVKGIKVKKSVKTTSATKEAASKPQKQSKHNVGDLHPNGKWVWTEYKPGKFDWRGIPKDGKTPKKTQAKKSAPKPEKKSESKKWTMRDFEERCSKGAGQGLTKTQKEAKKYLLRGYKIELIEDNEGHFSNSCFLKKEGEVTKSSFRDSIEGLFRKVGMEVPTEVYLPRSSK